MEEDSWQLVQVYIQRPQDEAIPAEEEQAEKSSEDQRESGLKDRSSSLIEKRKNTTLNVAHKSPHEADALYQFDDAIKDMELGFKKLTPQILTII